MNPLERFYLIVDDVSWIERMVPLGLRLVQLRIKDRTEREIGRQVCRALMFCLQYGAQLVINDYWRIAIAEGCDFVHLGQEDLDTADVGAIRGVGLKLGISTHDVAELDRALRLKPDYVALGPIYPTRLKVMRHGPQGLVRIGDWKCRIGDIPLVAIGGLTVERAAGVLNAGADTLSVVTDVTLDADPEKRLAEWLAAVCPR